MRVLVVANPISGRGLGMTTARTVAGRLSEAGHEASTESTRPGLETGWLRDLTADRDLLVVAGGDGAVRQGCFAVAGTSVPVYHLPCGTENLFSREWAMDRSPGTLLKAIEGGRQTSIDLGRAGPHRFVLMASVGLDAEVIEDLARHRSGSIRHRDYLGPIWRQSRRWRPPRLRVSADGERIDAGEPGMVVIGNSRQYAMRLDPAVRAEMGDGRFDVVHYPVRSRWELLRWAALTRLRRHVRHPDLAYVQARRIEVEADEPFLFQLDGETGGERLRRLEVRVEPGSVRVLLPQGRPGGSTLADT